MDFLEFTQHGVWIVFISMSLFCFPFPWLTNLMKGFFFSFFQLSDNYTPKGVFKYTFHIFCHKKQQSFSLDSYDHKKNLVGWNDYRKIQLM